MINFYPGPSKIYPEYRKIVYDLLTSTLPTYNHRSPEFEKSYRHSVDVLKEKLEVPDGYELFFLSSATECWESICQTFYNKEAYFLYNGAFGQKWGQIGKELMKKTYQIPFKANEAIDTVLSEVYAPELLAYVHNETSNGTVVRKPFQKIIRDKFPDALIAVDATSSLGASQVDYPSTDIVFASVQKCLGMPAGLAVMIISPKMIETLEAIEFTRHYNDLNEILLNHKKNQTTHTPNILAILSIGKLFEDVPSLQKQFDHIYKRAEYFEEFLKTNGDFSFLVDKPLRSKTVFCLQHKNVNDIISQAKSKGLIFGKGYGQWAQNTLRIANFPAHSDGEFEELKQFLFSCK